MIVSSVTVGPFAENCHLIVDEERKRAVLVDPGAEGARIVDLVRHSGATLEAVWLTHAHLDHIGGVGAVLRAWQVPVYLHPADLPLYEGAAGQAALYEVPFEQPPPPDRDLAEGDVMSVGGLRFDVIHLPGHAPGHVAFHGHGAIFSGDCLLAGSIGRTDLPLSDPAALDQSLARLAALPPETVVHCGHGPATTIGEEVRTNPFMSGIARVPRRSFRL